MAPTTDQHAGVPMETPGDILTTSEDVQPVTTPSIALVLMELTSLSRDKIIFKTLFILDLKLLEIL